MHGKGVCVAGGHVCQGVCMAGGMHGRDGHVWQGACMTEGHAWQGGVYGKWGCAWQEAGEMATAAEGTHPTGMHSCLNSLFIQKVQSICFINYPYTLIKQLHASRLAICHHIIYACNGQYPF